MKKILLAGLLLLGGATLQAQRVYFMYLQSETGTPFYIKMGGRVHTSSEGGYLLLPNLKDSLYSFSLGVPGSTGEPLFTIPVQGADRGFSLRQLDGGWRLFDLQRLNLISPKEGTASAQDAVGYREDQFSKTLAVAAGDPGLLVVRKPASRPEPAEKKEEAVRPERKADVRDTAAVLPATVQAVPPQTVRDTAVVVTADVPQRRDTVKAVPVEPDPAPVRQTITEEEKPFRRSVVRKRSESSTTEGFGLVYLDATEEGVDTIRLVIPNPRVKLVEEAPAAEAQPAAAVQQTPAAGAACTPAGEEVFRALRRTMVMASGDEGALDAARAAFRSHCYSTGQVRTLAALLDGDAGRYGLFDAAFGKVSDPEAFAGLEEVLKDDYYIRRFRALIAK